MKSCVENYKENNCCWRLQWIVTTSRTLQGIRKSRLLRIFHHLNLTYRHKLNWLLTLRVLLMTITRDQ